MLNVRLDLLFSGRIKILRICIIYILEFNQRRVNVLNSNIRFDSLSRRYLTRLTTCSTTYHQALYHLRSWCSAANPYRGPCSRIPRSTEMTRHESGELEIDHKFQGAGAVVAFFSRGQLPRELFWMINEQISMRGPASALAHLRLGSESVCSFHSLSQRLSL